MSAFTVRRFVVLLGLLTVGGIARQIDASRGAHARLERESDREWDLEDRLARSNQRIEMRVGALREYADGWINLADAARRFRQADAWDRVSAARVRRLWPDAPSDDMRYAAEVVQFLRESAERQPADLAVLVRAESDFWQEFGRSPDPVG